MMAVREAVTNGDADAIAAFHIPQNYDAKVCEFEYAKNGMIGLETLFGVIGKCIPVKGNHASWTLDKLITLLTVNSRTIFNMPVPEIKEGAAASITLFDPAAEYVFDAAMIASKSSNTPFVGKTLKGKVIGIINGDKIHIN